MFKDTVNGFYTALKSGLTTTKPISNWMFGFGNLANMSGATAMFVIDKGEIEIQTMSTSIAEIDCVLFIQNLKSTTQQNDLLQFLDNIYNFLKSNPRLGGIQELETGSWDISVSDDGLNVGLLTLEIKLFVQI